MTLAITRAILAWPPLVAALAIFGTSIFALALDGRDGARGGPPAALPRVWLWLSVTNAFFSIITVLAATADIAQVPIFAAVDEVPDVLVATHFGRVWIVRGLISIALLLAAAGAEPSRGRVGFICALSAMILLAQSASSHAYDAGTAAVMVHFIHQVGAAVWIGGLVGLALTLRSGGPIHDVRARMTRTVSRAAGWAVALIVATGLLAAYTALGWSHAQWRYSLYGQTLLAKLALAVGAVTIGAYNRWRVVPRVADGAGAERLRRNVTAEMVLIGLVLAFSALLAHFPPPH